MDPFTDLDLMLEEFGVLHMETERVDWIQEREERDTVTVGSWEDEEENEDHMEERLEKRITELYEKEREREDSNKSAESSTDESDGKCSCKENCLSKFEQEDIKEHMYRMREMEKSEKEMFIMASVQRFCNDETRKGKRRRTRYRFMFGGRQVCRQVFCTVNDIGLKACKLILKHLSRNGAVPRVHGNTGRKPHNALAYKEIKHCVDYLLKYANMHGLPMPAAPRGHDEAPPVYLPSNLTKKGIHDDYTQSCLEADLRHLGLSSFKGIWKHCIPHIRIMTPKEDVCHRCQLLKKEITDAVTDQTKLDSSERLRIHVEDALEERAVYKTCVKEAAEELSGYDVPVGPALPLSTALKSVHYTFDFCQNVVIPHHSLQMGPLYFISGRKVQIFGIRHDSTGMQYNYLIDENESIGVDGKLCHGPNAVISMLHNFMMKHGLGETKCILHADNCAGQNKNRYMLAYLCWRIHKGLHNEIELKMQIPGHTKCLVDGGFGHIKRLYKRTDCDGIRQLAEVVSKSAKSNTPVTFRNDDGEQNWEWFDWKTYLQAFFIPIKGIQKMHTFRVTTLDKNAVYVRNRSRDDERRIVIVKTVPGETHPDALPPAGLSLERQAYLFKTVRPYVRPPFQQETCPEPSEE